MKYKILLIALILGIFIGYAIFAPTNTPTAAITDCYAENQPCNCNTTDCKCGNTTLDSEYCKLDLSKQE